MRKRGADSLRTTRSCIVRLLSRPATDDCTETFCLSIASPRSTLALTDVEVAALWAAILAEEPVRVGGLDLKPYMVQFGDRPAMYRGTLTIPGRRRPVRHLVVAS